MQVTVSCHTRAKTEKTDSLRWIGCSAAR